MSHSSLRAEGEAISVNIAPSRLLRHYAPRNDTCLKCDIVKVSNYEFGFCHSFVSLRTASERSEESLVVEQKRSFTSFRACPELAEGMTVLTSLSNPK